MRNLPSGDTSAAVFFTHPGLAITPAHAFVLIGLLVALPGAIFGYLEAWPMSAARDFGPRLFAYFAGWGHEALPGPLNYWWIPIVAPCVGGILGGFLYQRLILSFLPRGAAKAIATDGHSVGEIGELDGATIPEAYAPAKI